MLAQIIPQLKVAGRKSLGIVLDADVDGQARWEKVRSLLFGAGYIDIPLKPIPTGTIVTSAGLPRVGLWLMPDNTAPGMLEDFLAMLRAPGDQLWEHAVQAVATIPPELRQFAPGHLTKAQLATFLAWQKSPGLRMSDAIRDNVLRAGTPIARDFVQWLRLLFG